jgi:hypothetical protein
MSGFGTRVRLYKQGDNAASPQQPLTDGSYTMQPIRYLIRLTSLVAAVLMTLLLAGGQLGLADRYAKQADAQWAAKSAPRVTQQAAQPPATGARI